MVSMSPQLHRVLQVFMAQDFPAARVQAAVHHFGHFLSWRCRKQLVCFHIRHDSLAGSHLKHTKKWETRESRPNFYLYHKWNVILSKHEKQRLFEYEVICFGTSLLNNTLVPRKKDRHSLVPLQSSRSMTPGRKHRCSRSAFSPSTGSRRVISGRSR